jgi:site-specific recombinase
MSTSGPLRFAIRTAADALIGLVLFLAFAFAIGAYERTSVVTHRLGDILAASSSAGDLLKFSLDDSPVIVAAVVATAVPVPQSGAVSGLRHTTRQTAFVLLAGIFSALVAFNLAFFRHLRREYASPRRGAWRGGSGSAGSP